MHSFYPKIFAKLASRMHRPVRNHGMICAMDDNQITIIEGPPPEFDKVEDGWALGLNESPILYDIAVTHLRTFNGPALVERCHRTWRKGDVMYLSYRNPLGLEESAPIMAVRSLETDDGHILLLWVRLENTESEETPDPPDLDD